MSYYWFNRKELLEKAHEKYHKEGVKEQAARFYKENKEAMKKKTREKYRNMSKEGKEKIKERSRNRYYKLKETVQKMNKTTVFNDVEVSKKEFYDGKKSNSIKSG